MTGVTVAVLTIGLFGAGVGTMVFLRGAQLTAIDEQLRTLVATDLASSLLSVGVSDGHPTFSPLPDAAPTQYVVAIYTPEGELVASAGGDGNDRPQFPSEYSLQKTVTRGIEPFALDSEGGSRGYQASVDVLAIDGVTSNYTQLVAIPLTTVNETVANYVGIYTLLAIVTVIISALLTRALVTLAFRGLGQVEDTAMSIASGNLRQRMGEIAPGTEVGKLKIAINAMLDRVDRAIAQRDSTVQQMRRFIGDASHELRTPLVTVRGYAELYRMGAITDQEQTRQSMERIEKEAIRMGVLVEDLLALARLDERRDIVVTAVDLRPIAQDAVLDAHATAPDRVVTLMDTSARATPSAPPKAAGAPASGARPAGNSMAGAASRFLRGRRRTAATSPNVALTAPIDTPDKTAPVPVAAPTPTGEPVVLGDENRIRQVVANLLTNARRYTPAGSPIEVAVGVDVATGMGWISVIDHGEGVPQQFRDKIFQRFWRADTSRTRETGGSGLGLSIVASVVDALHGSIDVVDTPGGGATFRAAFPLAKARDAAEHLYIETQPLQRLNASDTGAVPSDDAGR